MAMPGNRSTRLIARFGDRASSITRFVAAYRQYCWPVSSIDDLKLAPFHLLATEGKVHATKHILGTWKRWQRSALTTRRCCWQLDFASSI